MNGRSPCGERGLKCALASANVRTRLSLPVRGAWIEISRLPSASMLRVSLPVRGAWIEIITVSYVLYALLSLPVRGAWIEMLLMQCGEMPVLVAPRAGSVD